MRRRRRRRRRRTLKAPSCKRVIEQAALPAVTSTEPTSKFAIFAAIKKRIFYRRQKWEQLISEICISKTGQIFVTLRRELWKFELVHCREHYYVVYKTTHKTTQQCFRQYAKHVHNCVGVRDVLRTLLFNASFAITWRHRSRTTRRHRDVEIERKTINIDAICICYILMRHQLSIWLHHSVLYVKANWQKIHSC